MFEKAITKFLNSRSVSKDLGRSDKLFIKPCMCGDITVYSQHKTSYVVAVGLHITHRQHNVEKQGNGQNLHYNNYVDYITLIPENRTLQQLVI